MIGYAADGETGPAAAELFELLKVPAEPFRATGSYDCIITNGTSPAGSSGTASLVFSPSRIPFDAGEGLTLEPLRDRTVASAGAREGWKLQSALSAVDGPGEPVLLTTDGRCVGRRLSPGAERYGFDLFAEVAALLNEGQREEDALVPALELLLQLLRSRLRRRLTLVEIPPLPFGHDLVVGLSHDIDSLTVAERCRGERWLSLVRQSTVWPLEACLGGRAEWRSLARSWSLAATSPLVRLGAVRDPWDGKIEEYLQIERAADASSTYFFIPYQGRDGHDARNQPNHRRRAAMYDLASNRELVQHLRRAGAEIGVHGIDAWHDVKAATDERVRVAAVTGRDPDGVRMHYLYWCAESFRHLDAGGFAYDSTFGYPRTIGMRPGTLQPYRPLGAGHLLELPVTLEDTGLMSRVGRYCRPAEAVELIDHLLEVATRFGGALVVSWHDHSLTAPRFWRDPYLHLLAAAGARGAWSARLTDIAAWFRLRRAIRLSTSPAADRLLIEATVPEPWPDHLPPARLRVFPRGGRAGSFSDVRLRPGANRITVSVSDEEPDG